MTSTGVLAASPAGCVGDDGDWSRALFLTVGALALLFSHGQVSVSDGFEVFNTAGQVLDGNGLALDEQMPGGVEGRDGQRYSKYGLGGVLVFLLARAAALLPSSLVGHEVALAQAACASTVALASAWLVVSVAQVARHFGAHRRDADLVGVGAVFGTFALAYVGDSFLEPLSALAIARAALWLARGDGLRAGLWIGSATLLRPLNAVLVVALAAAFLLDRERRAATWTLLAGSGALVLTAIYNVLRFASPTDTGYRAPANPGFTTPFHEGGLGLLTDPRKSVFLFAPLVVLLPWAATQAWRRSPAPTAFLVATFAFGFVSTATWHAWDGAWSWGPRLLLPTLVPLLALIGSVVHRSRPAVRALAVMGALTSCAAVAVPPQAQQLDPLPSRNPSVLRQVELIGPTITRSLELGAQAQDHREVLFPWPMGVVRELGNTAGPPVAALLGAGFAVALLLAGRRLRVTRV